MTLARLALFALVIAACSACTDGEATSTSGAPSTTAPSQTSSTALEPSSTTQPGGAASSSTTVPTTTVPLDQLRLRVVEVGSGFDAPVFLHADPDGGADLVVEQPGRIVRLDDARTVVLDINGDVVYGGERGLLGLAFHPRFDENRLAYVNYTGGGSDTVIEQFTVGADGTFDVSSRVRILTIGQPARNHNGGMIAFGPDGYLWIGMGDGGGADDQFGHGQRPDTLLGAMLRIEVGVDGTDTYRIPPDNPGGEYAPEVWWTGLRNPWRFSFDSTDAWANVYIADVGQRAIEEVSVVPAGTRQVNLGWSVMEGNVCFRSNSCDTDAYYPAVIEYGHGEGCSITGGYVYRGTEIPELDGHYFFSDYCAGFLRSWPFEGNVIDWTDQVGSLGNVASFGVGGDTELYIITLSGSIYRLERAE